MKVTSSPGEKVLSAFLDVFLPLVHFTDLITIKTEPGYCDDGATSLSDLSESSFLQPQNRILDGVEGSWGCVHELHETRGGFRGDSADHRHFLGDRYHTTWSRPVEICFGWNRVNGLSTTGCRRIVGLLAGAATDVDGAPWPLRWIQNKHQASWKGAVRQNEDCVWSGVPRAPRVRDRDDQDLHGPGYCGPVVGSVYGETILRYGGMNPSPARRIRGTRSSRSFLVVQTTTNM